MKKLIIAVSLAAILIAGIFGGVVLASPPNDKVVDTPINPVVITSGGDINETPLQENGYSGWQGTYWIVAPTTAHVSLTVSTEGMVSGENVSVYLIYVDKETGDWELKTFPVIDYDTNCGDGTKTIEFDAARGEPMGEGLYGNWMVAAYCNRSDETNFTYYYNYTMTYPKQ